MIAQAEQKYGRTPGSVRLIGASKAQPTSAIRTLAALGVTAMGENYVQEAIKKQQDLADCDLEWHFIGHIQSNKTREIATHFAWVHSVDRTKIARRLAEQRPATAPLLNVCLEVNVDAQAGKSGASLAELDELARAVSELPRLKLRGLMAIPEPREEFAAQRRAFAKLRQARDRLNSLGLGLDTLSMGMSADAEAAIAEGATLIRLGTALFGPRPSDRPRPPT